VLAFRKRALPANHPDIANSMRDVALIRQMLTQTPTQNLREGCRVELTGLSSKDLNGQRGHSGGYFTDRGRWPVVLDGTGRKLSCKPTNLKVLAT
jgi:hypothetical protein